MSSLFICKRCGYDGQFRQSLERHLNKKFTCTVQPGFDDIPIDSLLEDLHMAYKSKKYVCEFCASRFAHSSNMYSHKKRCIVALHREQNKPKEVQAAQVPAVKNKRATTTFTCEDVSYLDLCILDKCYKNMDLTVLIDNVHFHPDHSENHNVRIKNVKLNQMEYFSENRWIMNNKREVLAKIIENSCNHIENYIKNNSQNLLKEMGENDYYTSLVWMKKLKENLDKVLFSKTKAQIFYFCITKKLQKTTSSK